MNYIAKSRDNFDQLKQKTKREERFYELFSLITIL